MSKTKKFFSTFIAFLKSILNFKHLPRKVTLIGYVSPKIPAPKNMVRKMSKKPCFRGRLDRKHGRLVERMIQSE